MPDPQPDLDADRPAAPATSLRPTLARIASGATLDEGEAQWAFDLVMQGRGTPAQIAALAMGLRLRGETVPELVGAARAMRAHMTDLPGVPGAIDVCGTGGDGRSTLNVSTAVAFVLAALGVPVAKHGNRAVSSRAGALDTLEALGLPAEADPARLQASLQRHNIAFLAAALHHPAMRHAAPVRAELGFRTIFNLLGPLCNPAGVRRQMIGVFDPAWQLPVARALCLLGAERAWVVHGEDTDGNAGIDELSLAGVNRIVALQDGRLRRFDLRAAELGLAPRPLAAIAGGDASFNAGALHRLLEGAPGPYRDTVLLNAAAALQVARGGNISSGRDDEPAEGDDRMVDGMAPIEQLQAGLAQAARVLDDGAAMSVLRAMRPPEAVYRPVEGMRDLNMVRGGSLS